MRIKRLLKNEERLGLVKASGTIYVDHSFGVLVLKTRLLNFL